jgi:hypothetical protein
LLAKNLINPTTLHPLGTTANPKVYQGHEMGAVYNFLLVENDKSHGMHNYKYTKALLQNSIDAIK